ncbi:hypothetical protein BML2526_19940 [Providencia rettgeri]|nr:hypothetical protein BML2526_19940 [Providencia rettgeri]BBV11420.1 hypothetical protein BML2576_08790 [Providencia rettgeri]
MPINVILISDLIQRIFSMTLILLVFIFKLENGNKKSIYITSLLYKRINYGTFKVIISSRDK